MQDIQTYSNEALGASIRALVDESSARFFIDPSIRKDFYGLHFSRYLRVFLRYRDGLLVARAREVSALVSACALVITFLFVAFCLHFDKE